MAERKEGEDERRVGYSALSLAWQHASLDAHSRASFAAALPAITSRTHVEAAPGAFIERRRTLAAGETLPPAPDGLARLAPTPVTLRHLQLLAGAVALTRASPHGGRPVLVEGPAGSGKTSLVRHLAALAGYTGESALVELHLDDSSDGKALLGGYSCTDVPGEFTWTAGAITSAAREGWWVLIEDIDRAPFDVLAALAPLVERRTLILPGQPRALLAARGFQLFATRSTPASPAHGGGVGARRGADPIAGPFGAFVEHWLRVRLGEGASAPSTMTQPLPLVRSIGGNVEAEVTGELRALLLALHPSFPPLCVSSLLHAFEVLQHVVTASGVGGCSSQESVAVTPVTPLVSALPDAVVASLRALATLGRPLSPRDILRWANRIETLTPLTRRVAAAGVGGTSGAIAAPAVFLTEDDKLAMVHEGSTVLAGHAPTSAVRRAVAHALALVWGLPTTAAEALEEQWKPEIAYAAANSVLQQQQQRSTGGGSVVLSIGNIALPVSPAIISAAAQMGRVLDPLPFSFVPTRHSLRLLERCAACVAMDEPMLLVGETGNGKTSVVQALASAVGARLLVYNLNVQSDSGDLLGGYKPVHLKQAAMPLVARFEALLTETFDAAAAVGGGGGAMHRAYADAVRAAAHSEQWPRMIGGMMKAVGLARSKSVTGSPSAAAWDRLAQDVRLFERQFTSLAPAAQGASTAPRAAAFAFTFAEGILIEALRTGSWLLLDEINLASAETLQRLAGLLEGGSLTLTERGDTAPIPRHPQFRLFAAMNPATDHGKRDLPPALRSRFSEVWVEEVEDPRDLYTIIQRFVSSWPVERCRIDPALLCDRLVALYLTARRLSAPITGVLRDGASSRPRYSLRTLTRALRAASLLISNGSLVLRAVYEGVCMSMLTQLEDASANVLGAAINEHLAPLAPGGGAGRAPGRIAKRQKDAQAALTENVIARIGGGVGGAGSITAEATAVAAEAARLFGDADAATPRSHLAGDASTSMTQGDEFVQVAGFWLPRGPLEPVDLTAAGSGGAAPRYVLVPSVSRHVRNLARAVLCGRSPVLLQGPTSAGKTSMVEYLAARLGHSCVRINNHEHTDIGEYLGSYVTDPRTGRLTFAEGLLVQALRSGAWLILDELNLAPSEVLEALNRLLDDNRELFIPETQETVRPHRHFILFATQNPAGAYGGRKPLSQAFRNRFVELHLDDIPCNELVTILSTRARLPTSFAERMVAVMVELQRLRQGSDVFSGKHGFITPRDLLRWAGRRPATYTALAREGFMLLGERLRISSEREVVRGVLERILRVSLDVTSMYDAPFSSFLEDEVEGASAAGNAVVGGKRPFENASSLDAAPSESQGVTKRARSGSTSGATPALPASNDPFDDGDAVTDAFSAQVHARLHSFLSLLHGGAATPPLDAGVDLTPGAVLGTEGLGSITITRALRRLFTLVGRCIANDEAVLLVGDTGCGKTTVVQLFALLLQRPLAIVNCHAQTETADFLGSQRPLRNSALHVARAHAAAGEYVARLPAPALRSPQLLTADDATTASVPSEEEAEALRAQRLASIPQLGPEELVLLISGLHAALEAMPAEASSSLAPLCVLKAAIESEARAAASLFEWADGPLPLAMREGSFFLLDEASLAEDAVLERLNSVLEPGRTLTLAEKGGEASSDTSPSVFVKAAPTFRFFATMNPGGDFGKRELSPALRNRFTEIWVPALTADNEDGDMRLIIASKAAEVALKHSRRVFFPIPPSMPQLAPASAPPLSLHRLMRTGAHGLAPFILPMLSFVAWFDATQQQLGGKSSSMTPSSTAPVLPASATASAPPPQQSRASFQLTLRDLHAWLTFMGSSCNTSTTIINDDDAAGGSCFRITPWQAYAHGACLVLLDGLGLGTGAASSSCSALRLDAARFLLAQAPPDIPAEEHASLERILLPPAPPLSSLTVSSTIPPPSPPPPGTFGLAPFAIPLSSARPVSDRGFALGAPTTRSNLLRVLRGMQLSKPILLEGSPGVGKTSLIEALAAASGHSLVRINLSDQTDLADLFGQDLPKTVEAISDDASAAAAGGRGGFRWCDGVFLQALKAGSWVLLDELNLAPQPVLEGLNAVLDHRSSVYIPELGESFACPPTFRVFATQNPVAQGGGRKGLPKSFLNRFIKVHVEPLLRADQLFIAAALYPQLHVPLTTSTTRGDSEMAVVAQQEENTVLSLMVDFNIRLHEDTMGGGDEGGSLPPIYGGEGRPWEFNLRDLFRWCELVINSRKSHVGDWLPGSTLAFAYLVRLRTPCDRIAAAARFLSIFSANLVARDGVEGSVTCLARSLAGQLDLHTAPVLRLSRDWLSIDDALLPRSQLRGVWAPRQLYACAAAAPSSIASATAVGGALCCAVFAPLACALRSPISVSRHAAETPSSAPPALSPALLRPLYFTAVAVAHAWPVLLVGGKSSGKSTTITALAHLTGARLRHVVLTPSTDASELVGCFEQTTSARGVTHLVDTVAGVAIGVFASAERLLALIESARSADREAVVSAAAALQHALASLSALEQQEPTIESAIPTLQATMHLVGVMRAPCAALEALHACDMCTSPLEAAHNELARLSRHAAALSLLPSPASVSSPQPRGAFEWVDGALVEAMERGEWVILDAVNVCPSAVIDRLNPVLEPKGELLLNECGPGANGRPRRVIPHPAFRIFFTQNASMGDVSRALRNRCVEIALTDSSATPASAALESADAARLVRAVTRDLCPPALSLALLHVSSRLLAAAAPSALDLASVAASAGITLASLCLALIASHQRGGVDALSGLRIRGDGAPRPRALLHLSELLAAGSALLVAVPTPASPPHDDVVTRSARGIDLMEEEDQVHEVTLPLPRLASEAFSVTCATPIASLAQNAAINIPTLLQTVPLPCVGEHDSNNSGDFLLASLRHFLAAPSSPDAFSVLLHLAGDISQPAGVASAFRGSGGDMWRMAALDAFVHQSPIASVIQRLEVAATIATDVTLSLPPAFAARVRGFSLAAVQSVSARSYVAAATRLTAATPAAAPLLELAPIGGDSDSPGVWSLLTLVAQRASAEHELAALDRTRRILLAQFHFAASIAVSDAMLLTQLEQAAASASLAATGGTSAGQLSLASVIYALAHRAGVFDNNSSESLAAAASRVSPATRVLQALPCVSAFAHVPLALARIRISSNVAFDALATTGVSSRLSATELTTGLNCLTRLYACVDHLEAHLSRVLLSVSHTHEVGFFASPVVAFTLHSGGDAVTFSGGAAAAALGCGVLLWRKLIKTIRAAWRFLSLRDVTPSPETAASSSPPEMNHLLLHLQRCSAALSGNGTISLTSPVLASLNSRGERALDFALARPRDALWRHGGHPSVPRTKSAFTALESVRTFLLNAARSPAVVMSSVTATSDGLDDTAAAAVAAFSSHGLREGEEGGSFTAALTLKSSALFVSTASRLTQADLLPAALKLQVLGMVGTLMALGGADEAVGHALLIQQQQRQRHAARLSQLEGAAAATVDMMSAHITSRTPQDTLFLSAAPAASGTGEWDGASPPAEAGAALTRAGDDLGVPLAVLDRLGVSPHAGPLLRRAVRLGVSSPLAAAVELWCLSEERSISAAVGLATIRAALHGSGVDVGSAIRRRIERLLRVAAAGTRWSPLAILPLQPLVWALATKSTPAVINCLTPLVNTSWHHRFASSGGSGDEGASAMVPEALVAAVAAAPCPLHEFEARIYLTQLLAGHAVTNAPSSLECAVDEIASPLWREASLLTCSAAHLLLACGAALGGTASESFTALVTTWWESLPLSRTRHDTPHATESLPLHTHDTTAHSGTDSAAESLVAALRESTNTRIAAIAHDGTLTRALACIRRALHASVSAAHLPALPMQRATVAAAALAVHHVRFWLLLPSDDVDPAEKPILKRANLGVETEGIEGTLASRLVAVALAGGPSAVGVSQLPSVESLTLHAEDADDMTAALAHEALTLRQQASLLTTRAVYRPSPSSGPSNELGGSVITIPRYGELVAEAHAFAASLATPARVTAFIKTLSSATGEGAVAVVPLETLRHDASELRTWSAAATSFATRVGHIFTSSAYADVAAPIEAAVWGMALAADMGVAALSALTAAGHVMTPTCSTPAAALRLQSLARVELSLLPSTSFAPPSRSIEAGAALSTLLTEALEMHRATTVATDTNIAAMSGLLSGETEEEANERQFRAFVPDFFEEHYSGLLPRAPLALGASSSVATATGAPTVSAPGTSVLRSANGSTLHRAASSAAALRARDLLSAYVRLWAPHAATSFSSDGAAGAFVGEQGGADGLRLLMLEGSTTSQPVMSSRAHVGVSSMRLLRELQRLTASRAAAVATTDGSVALPPAWSFYRDSNVAEAAAAIPPLRAFAARALELLLTFPGNEVLCLLLRVADQCACLSVEAPIAALLTGAELIVTKGHDWEVNAPRTLQLGPALGGVSQLVTRWRRLELASWATLLRPVEREESCGEAVGELFLQFRAVLWGDLPPDQMVSSPTPADPPLQGFAQWLLPSLGLVSQQSIAARHIAWALPGAMRTSAAFVPASTGSANGAAASLPSPADAYLQGAFESADRFLRSSPLGQFASRLALLTAAAEETAAGAVAPHTSPSRAVLLHRVSSLLRGVRAFYGQYEKAVGTALTSAKAPLLKAVHDQVKLHKWDEQSYYALQASAAKAHRIVYKAVAGYREVLGRLASPVIEDYSPLSTSLDAINDAVESGAAVAVTLPLSKRRKQPQHREVISRAPPGSSIAVLLSASLAPLAESTPLHSATPASSAYSLRLGGILRRTLQLLCRRNGGLVGIAAAKRRAEDCDAVEVLASDLLETSAHFLACAPTTPQQAGAVRQQKKRAITDALRIFARYGLSPLSSAIPPQQHDASALAQLPSPASLVQHASDAVPWASLPVGLANALRLVTPSSSATPTVTTTAQADFTASLGSSLSRGTSYYERSLDQLIRLRLATASGTRHVDISASEARRGLGFCEHLFALVGQQRVLLAGLDAQSAEFARAISLLDDALQLTLVPQPAGTHGPTVAPFYRVQSIVCSLTETAASLRVQSAQAGATRTLLRSLARTMTSSPAAIAAAPWSAENILDEALLLGIISNAPAEVAATTTTSATTQQGGDALFTVLGSVPPVLMRRMSAANSLVAALSSAAETLEAAAADLARFSSIHPQPSASHLLLLPPLWHDRVCGACDSAAGLVSACSPSADDETTDAPPALLLVSHFQGLLTAALDACRSCRITLGDCSSDGAAASTTPAIATATSTFDAAVEFATTAVMLSVQQASSVGATPSSPSPSVLWGLYTPTPPSAPPTPINVAAGNDTLVAATPDDGSDGEFSLTSDHNVNIPATVLAAARACQALRLPTLASAAAFLHDAIVAAVAASGGAGLSSDQVARLRDVTSLLRGTALAHASVFGDALQLHAASAKLCLVASASLLRLTREGFCMPETGGKDGEGEGEGEGGGKGGEENKAEGKFHAGTGMGEGEGQQDVSEQIENEEQVLGLRGEAPPPPRRDGDAPQPPESKGVEVAADFEGDEFDMPPPEDNDDDDGGKGDGKEEEGEEELDREFGAADDANAAVVDEKLWDGGEDDDDGDEEQPEQRDAPAAADQAVAGGKRDRGMRAKRGEGKDDQTPAGGADAGAEDDTGGGVGEDEAMGEEEKEEGGGGKEGDDDEGVDDAPLDGKERGGGGSEGEDDDAPLPPPPTADGVKEEPEEVDLQVKGDLGHDSDKEAPQTEGSKLPQPEEGKGRNRIDAHRDDVPPPEEEGGIDGMEEEGAGGAEDAAAADTAAAAADAAGQEADAPPEDSGDLNLPEGMQLDGVDEGAEDAEGEGDVPPPPDDAAAQADDAVMEDAAAAAAAAAELDASGGGAAELPQEQKGLDAGSPDAPAPPLPPSSDAHQQKQPPAPGVAAQQGRERLSRQQGASAQQQQQVAPPPDDAMEETVEASAGAEEAAIGMKEDAVEESPPTGAQQEQKEGQDGPSGGTEEGGGGHVWQRAAPQQQAPEAPPLPSRVRHTQDEASARRGLEGAEEDANPLNDPEKALRHWQARIRELAGAAAAPSPPTDDAPDAHSEPVLDGRRVEGDMDVIATASGGATMLAPREEKEGVMEEEEEKEGGDHAAPPALPKEDAPPPGAQGEEATAAAASATAPVPPTAPEGEATEPMSKAQLQASQRERQARQRRNAPMSHPLSLLPDGVDPDTSGAPRTVAEQLLEQLARSDDGPQSADRMSLPVVPTIKPPIAPDGGAAAAAGDEQLALIVDPAALRAEHEEALSAWAGGRAAGVAAAGAAWNALCARTSDASTRLCEGLRLVLEPTLASRLGGDFRSGKRLNMRRIIPYIASSFRKDKIWQRRSKPSRRTYQILLAIDDSSSMAPANRGGGTVGCEALALIVRALSRLEVGEVGVMSFGTKAQLLHALGEPFTDDAGARVLSQFTFAQEGTRTEALMSSVTAVMGEARAAAGARSAGAAASLSSMRCMQLLFVISDGFVGTGAERERVRGWVTEAAAKGLLIVLVIVDKVGGSGGAGAAGGAGARGGGGNDESILSTQSVRFVDGAVVRSAYLDDTYPFPTYILCRDLSALPEALSDVLRQWFAMASSGQGS